MKSILLPCLFVISTSVMAQATFKMPDEIKFNNLVVQKMEDKKKAMLSYYFTASGDYMAMKPDSKESSLIIYTKEGDMLVVNEKEKSIIVMNLKKFVTHIAPTGKDMKDKKQTGDSSGTKTNFRKTGKTKPISGYTAEEYEIKRENELINVWYLKADFSANLLGFFGFGKMENIPNAKRSATPSQFENIPDLGSNYLLAEMEKNGKTILQTERVEKTNFTFSTTGYSIRDMTNLMKGNPN